MQKLIHKMMKDSGKDINEILDMPFSFFMETIQEKEEKPKKERSLISAFGG